MLYPEQMYVFDREMYRKNLLQMWEKLKNYGYGVLPVRLSSSQGYGVVTIENDFRRILDSGSMRDLSVGTGLGTMVMHPVDYKILRAEGIVLRKVWDEEKAPQPQQPKLDWRIIERGKIA